MKGNAFLELLTLILTSEVLAGILKTGVAAIVIRKLYSWWTDKSGRLFKRTSMTYRRIKEKVKETQIEFLAFRVAVIELSNGGVWLSTMPKYKVTMTVEQPAEGVPPIAGSFEEKPATGELMDLLQELNGCKTIYIPDLSKEKNTARRDLLNAHGAESIWLYMMHRDGRIPLGVLVVSFHRPNICSKSDVGALLHRAKIIERMFQVN